MEGTLTAQLAAFNQVYKDMDDLYHEYARKWGMSDAAMWILYFIQESDTPKTQKELCDEWCYSRQTVNSALKNMESKGLIRFACAEGNRKNKQILLTEEGQELSDRVIRPLVEAELAALDSLGEAGRGELLLRLKQYLSMLHRGVESL
ncbi:MAG: MarR family transcriptional regulator [Eubacteriales bacterium]|nr:MarR family transcriptional regulator [Eubacteriales bacterium]